ncbi:MAG: aminotransferase class V-fold PLP-dependent enzyme [Caldilineaceae bacterium]
MSTRDRFPIFQDKTYINSCSQGALSVDVIEAYQSYLRDWQEQGSPWDAWVGKLEATRHAFAGLVNARADEVAVVASVSDGVSSLAGALDFSGPRNKIVATDFDFPTTAQIWHAQEARGAHVVHVQAAGNQLPIERFADAIDERTLLVSIPHVCYRNGTKTDPRPIIELAHAKGALVLLDAYQSLGTTRMDVRELDVDFLTGGALKYLLGSPGVAFLYAAPTFCLDSTPTWAGLPDRHLRHGHLPPHAVAHGATLRKRHARGARDLRCTGRTQAGAVHRRRRDRATDRRGDGRAQGGSHAAGLESGLTRGPDQARRADHPALPQGGPAGQVVGPGRHHRLQPGRQPAHLPPCLQRPSRRGPPDRRPGQTSRVVGVGKQA